MTYSATPTEELRDLLIDKLFENPNDIVVEDTIDYITNTQKEITRLQQENQHLKDKIDKTTELIKENVYIDYYGVATFRSQKCVDELLEILEDKDEHNK